HVGMLHLVLNATGLFILGWIAEDLFGGARVIALFGVAGVSGAVASYLAAPVGISAGASGAVFGLLGAVFVEITWNREHYRSAWRRGMWGALAVIAAAAIAAVQVARTSLTDSLAAGGTARHVIDGFAIEAPAGWRVQANQL